MVQPWYVKIIKFVENSPLLARNSAQNRKLASLTRIAPQDMTRRDGLSSWRVILFVTAGMLRGKCGAMYTFWMENRKKPNSFRLGIFFQVQVWNEDSDPPSLTSRERASKNLEQAQLSPLEVVVRANHKIC